MSVQKKSLISQRSAVKSALLATPQTSNLKPATQSAIKPAMSKGSIRPSLKVALKPALKPALKHAVKAGMRQPG
jgi:hypothetical protein